MLSGNGRHRRPRQAPAIIVAAGVTGSAIALPLLGAASAHAADGTTWDSVAQCESGGSWSSNPGTGFYGGLLISQEDWDKYGGTQYAESADEASRSQQIAVAEKILADQGTTPWATCALLAGLTPGSGSVDVDPGAGDSGSTTPAADPGGTPASTDTSVPGSGHASDKSGLPDSSPSSDSSSKGKGASTPGASETGDSASAESGTEAPESGKMVVPGYGGGRVSDGQVTMPSVVQDPDNSWQTGGSWTLVDTGALGSGGRHRGGSADETANGGEQAASSARHATRDQGDYTVREGDTLASIADSLDVHGGWHALYAQNKKSIGADPNDIAPGQALKVAGENGGK